jgi:hypothetical protein
MKTSPVVSPDGYPEAATYEGWIWHDEVPQPGADRPGRTQLRAAGAASTGGVGA